MIFNTKVAFYSVLKILKIVEEHQLFGWKIDTNISAASSTMITLKECNDLDLDLIEYVTLIPAGLLNTSSSSLVSRS